MGRQADAPFARGVEDVTRPRGVGVLAGSLDEEPARERELVRSLVIGGGATAVPLRVGGALKDIIEAPDMEGYRQIDSKEILGPVYDAIPGGAPPPDVRTATARAGSPSCPRA